MNPKYTLFSAPKIDDNILILNNKHLTKIDFKNLTFTNYSKGKAFSAVDNKYPSFIDDKNLYYISDLNDEKLLNSIDIASIDNEFNSETFPLIINESKIIIHDH